jgi:archaemetzincin
MRFRVFIVLPALILLFSCTGKDGNKKKSKHPALVESKEQNHTLAILPFTGVDSGMLYELKTGLEKHLHAQITVLDAAALPSFAFYKPRQRYIADSLLVFLKLINDGRFEKIIGITTKDISTRKEPHENWGILGLGSCPGIACVISSFRAGKTKVSYNNYIRRMITLALHETGHTFGLEHCPVATCIMKDAEGKMDLDDGDSFCNKCRGLLAGKGLLK